jgi:hypothetical protein
MVKLRTGPLTCGGLDLPDFCLLRQPFRREGAEGRIFVADVATRALPARAPPTEGNDPGLSDRPLGAIIPSIILSIDVGVGPRSWYELR